MWNFPIITPPCDLFVLPSDYEGTAAVLVEAASASKPVVSTKVSGADEIVADGVSGYIVDIQDPHGLADRIIDVISNSELAWRMGAEGQKRVVHKYGTLNITRIVDMWNETVRIHQAGVTRR